jgi:hypothetical protein
MRRPDGTHLYRATALLTGVTLFASACSSSTHKAATAADGGEEAEAVVLSPDAVGRRQHEVFIVKNATVSALATVGRDIAWTQLEGPEEKRTPGLLERDGSTGHVRELASDVVPPTGVAASPSRVVYARTAANGVELVTLRRSGGTPAVIGRDVATPIAVRDGRVAWAEQSADEQRVVVWTLATGSAWTAARFARCAATTRCYRIDNVALADGGVVFNRNAIGTQPSLVVRRRFGAAAPQTHQVPHDPQPDLAQSSSGAFFYVLGRGWQRWDFGTSTPVATPLRSVRPWLLGYDNGAMLLQTGETCSPRLIVRRPGKRDIVARPPVEVPRQARSGPPGTPCRLMSAYDWNDRHLLVAWTLTTEETIDTHAEAAPVAVVTAIPTR